MQAQGQYKIEKELDIYIESAVENGVNYNKLEKWMEKWDDLSNVSERYTPEEVYEAFHKMPSKIKKYTSLINGEEMYFVLDKYPKDHTKVKIELVQLLEKNNLSSLIDIELLKHAECKQLIKYIRFNRELPVHLSNILVKNKSTQQELLDNTKNIVQSAILAAKETTTNGYANMIAAYKWLEEKDLKTKTLNVLRVIGNTTKTMFSKLSQKCSNDLNRVKNKFLEAKANNFGINFTEVKNNLTNLVFYTFLGSFIVLLMLINL